MRGEIVVALDAMGGDHAPRALVEGAMKARREWGIKVLLVGDEERIRAELEQLGGGDGLEEHIVHTPVVVGMDEEGAWAFRHKPESSVAVAARLVREGKAQAMVSAGNTGAAMAAATLSWGRLKGIKRPAIAVPLPSAGSRVFLLDAGANPDCQPEHLRQFALLGSVYASLAEGGEWPRVGLLNIGEEEGKGNELAREAHRLLRGDRRINFVGNVEGRELLSGKADVVVTDGFTGNVVLKTVEGIASLMANWLLEEVSCLGESKAGEFVPVLLKLKERLDYRNLGGAPLLGVKGVCIIAHGRSDATAVGNSIRVAAEAVRQALPGRTEALLAEMEA